MENKLNSLVLFKNDKKTDKHPDYQGSIVLEDGEHYLSVWVNTSSKGTKYMSGTVGKLKNEKQDSHNQAKSNGYAPQDDFDDNIPF